MLNKNKKWLSWLLTVAMLITLIPLNGLSNSVFAATYNNATLQTALDNLTVPPTATLVNVSNKDIIGGVSTSQIKTKFGQVKHVNLSNNFITAIDTDAPSITKIVEDGNLLKPAQRAITWSGGAIERLRYKPEAINLADEFTKMTVAGKPGMTVKQLIDKGVIERLEVMYNGDLQAGVTLANPNIPDTDVKTWAGSHSLELKFFYKDVPNEPVTVSKTVTMHELKELKIDGVSTNDLFFKNIEKTIYVTKIGHNNETVPVESSDIGNFVISSTSGVYNEVTKVVENDKLKVTFKFTSEFDDKDLKVIYIPIIGGSPALKAKADHLRCKAIKVVGIELIDEQTPNTAGAPKVTVVTPADGGVHPTASQQVHIAKGTNCSAFEIGTYTQREPNLTTGKYYVKVKRENENWEYLKDQSFLDVFSGGGLGATVNVDSSGFVYLEVSADDNAPGGTVISVKPSTNVLPLAPIPTITLTPVLKDVEPEAYRIYQFEESDINTFNSASDIDAALRAQNAFKFYEVKLTDTNQNGNTEFEIKEGSHKYYYPVGVYKKQGSTTDKILKAVPFTQQKIWYQKEKSASQPFDNNTPFGPATGYGGAPLEGTKITGATQLSSGLKVKAVPKTVSTLTNVGTVALAMHHHNNNGIWFKIKWLEKEVKHLVPISANHLLTLSRLNINNPADKNALIDEIKKLPGNVAYGAIGDPVNISVPIGTDYEISVLAIYDNGTVEEVTRKIEKTAMSKGADATSAAESDITIEQNPTGKWKIVATEDGETRDDGSGRLTDGKEGNYTALKINKMSDTTSANNMLMDFASVKLDYSNIKDIKLIAHDNIRLALKPDGKTYEVNSGNWHEGSTANMYQGNAGGNKKLLTTIYHIPVFTNKNLNTVDVTAATQDDTELKKVAFDENVYRFDPNTKFKVYDDSYQRQVHTSEELSKVNNVGSNESIQWKIKDSMKDSGKMKPYKNHKFSDTNPASHERQTTVTVKEPLYLTVGAIEELVDTASPDNGKITTHNGNDAISVDLGETKNLRIKLSNSMFTAFRTLDKFTDSSLKYIKDGVYFYGNEAVTAAGVLTNKSSDFDIDATPIGFKPDATGVTAYRDLFALYLASGQQNGITPSDYELTHIGMNSDVYARKITADRKTALEAELAKIKVKVFAVNGATETLLSDAEVATQIDVKNTPNKPGMFDITPHRRGHYRVRFVTEQDGVESPLFKHYDMATGNTVYGEGDGAEDWHIDVNVNKAKIKKIYYHIPENVNGINTGITVIENAGDQIVKIGSLSPSETQKEILVYPVVEDITLNHRLNHVGDFATLGQIKTQAETDGKTLNDLLNEAGSGLSYMDDASVQLQQLVEADWKNMSDPAIKPLITTDWTRVDGHLALKVIVQKGEIKNTDNAKVKLDIQAEDFDAQAKMLTAGSIFKPADAPILMGEIQIEQQVQDWITDIRLTPLTANVINKTESYQTAVEYVTAKGQISHLTNTDIADLNVASPASRQLKVEKIEGPECQIIPVAGNPAKLTFKPSKVGKYKFVVTTLNELNKPVPPIGETRTIEFEVKPTIKTPYDLYYGQALQIEVDADDMGSLTYEAQTPDILDTAALSNHKLKIDSNWAGLSNSPGNVEVVIVKVFDATHTEIGQFTVNVHPRGSVDHYQLLPITTDAAPYETKDGDRVELRVKKIFQDQSFEYTKIKAVTFKTGYDDGVTEQLTESFADLDASSVTDTSAFLTIKPVSAPLDNNLKWHGEYEVTIDEDPAFKAELHLLKTDNPTHLNRNFEFYRLMADGTVKKVSDLTSPMMISKQQAATEKLFVVEEEGGQLFVVNDYVLDVNPNDKIVYRMFDRGAGGAKTDIGGIDDIKNNPDTYSCVEFNPIDVGAVALTAHDISGTSHTEANYQITDTKPLRVSHNTAYTVTEGDTLTIVATVDGGDVATRQLQWQESSDGTTWNDIVGETSDTLNIPNIPLSANGHQYQLKATDQHESVTSTPATLTVNPAPAVPTGNIAPATLNKQVGQSGTFTVVLPSSVVPTSYQWKKQAEGATTWTPVPGATTNSYTIPSIIADMDGDKYTCDVMVGTTQVTISNEGKLVVVDSSGVPINTRYRVTFKAGAHGTLRGHGPSWYEDILRNTPITNVPTVDANPGYRFTGWAEGTAAATPGGTLVTRPITYTAQYSVVSGGGGSGGSGGSGSGGSTPAQPTAPTQPTKPTTPTQPTVPTQSVLQLNKNVKFAYLAGYPDGTVRANNPITRAEVSAIFARIMLEEMVVGKTYPSQFKDVVSGKWFSNYIGFLEDYKVLTGYPDGAFKPNNKITRAEFAVIVSKFFETKTADMNFKDVKANHWAKQYIDSLVANNMMGGYPDGTFKPEQAITRAEVVTVINKAINRTPDKATIDANPKNEKKYKDLNKNHWAYYDVIEASTDYTADTK